MFKKAKKDVIRCILSQIINIKVHLGVIEAYLVNIGEFLSTFAHI